MLLACFFNLLDASFACFFCLFLFACFFFYFLAFFCLLVSYASCSCLLLMFPLLLACDLLDAACLLLQLA
jgi:hypothetical protein